VPDSADELSQLRNRVESLHEQVARLQTRISALEGPPALQPSNANPHLESGFGLAAVNRIGAFTLAIGIIFFFKYAVDNEWIGAAGRVIAGLIGGLLLIAGAELLNRRQQRTFSQGISGCGIATLYISLYAAFGYYNLISQSVAFFALIAICSVAVAFSFRYRNAAIAALGFLGGVITPILLQPKSPAPWPDALYLFLLDLTCVVIAVTQRWAVLIPGIGAATLLAAAFLLDSHLTDRFALFAFALAAMHMIAASRRSDTPALNHALYLTGTGCLMFGTLAELHLWTSRNIAPEHRGSAMSELGSVFLGLYAIVTLSYGIARSSAINRSLGLFLLGLIMVKLYFWDVWFLDRFYRTTAFVSLGLLLLAASWIYSRSKPQ
jgi:uncharacterized membrane protein